MEVIVKMLRADFIKESNWFIQMELEQISYPSKQKTKQKQRSEILSSYGGSFLKNYFSFKASLSNRISLRFGAIEATNYSERKQIDPSKCVCQGLFTLVITKRLLAALRDQIPLKDTYLLVNPTTHEEVATVTLSISLNVTGVEEQIIEDDRKFSKLEYDHYEKNEEIIKEKTSVIEIQLEAKSVELAQWMDKVDHLKNAIRSLGADVALLKKEKDMLEVENKEILRKVERLSSVDDIHIKVDMLITSPQGADLLRVMLERTENRLKFQRMIYAGLSENWLKIEGKKRKLDELKLEVEKVKEAQTQLQFHMLTLKDQLPQALSLRENVKSLDGLIKDFEQQISKARTIKKDKAVEVEVANLKHKRMIMLEKQKQVQILLESNEGALPLEEIEKLQMEQIEENSESADLKLRGEELLAEIERLGNELSRQTYRPKSSSGNQVELEVKLQAAQIRVESMQRKMSEQAAEHAKEVAKFELMLAELDAKIGKYD